MRGHDLYHEFDRRWQLPVYFQLRWKEIVVSLEETLSETCIESSVMRGRLSSFPECLYFLLILLKLKLTSRWVRLHPFGRQLQRVGILRSSSRSLVTDSGD